MRSITTRILSLTEQGHGLREAISIAEQEQARYNREVRVAAYKAAGPRRSLPSFQRERAQEASRIKAIGSHNFTECSRIHDCCTHFDR